MEEAKAWLTGDECERWEEGQAGSAVRVAVARAACIGDQRGCCPATSVGLDVEDLVRDAHTGMRPAVSGLAYPSSATARYLPAS